MIHKCRKCGDLLTNDNWYPCNIRNSNYICNDCEHERHRLWRESNPDKVKAQWTRAHRKKGQLSMNDNKMCSLYLGIYVAENLLSHVFKNVNRMPHGNVGFDFVCANNKKIDVKSACLNTIQRWSFNIRRNAVADYFLCVVFDNRDDLNPLYVWLLPGDEFNHLTNATISPNTFHKWDEYRLDINKVISCCNEMKAST